MKKIYLLLMSVVGINAATDSEHLVGIYGGLSNVTNSTYDTKMPLDRGEDKEKFGVSKHLPFTGIRYVYGIYFEKFYLGLETLFAKRFNKVNLDMPSKYNLKVTHKPLHEYGIKGRIGYKVDSILFFGTIGFLKHLHQFKLECRENKFSPTYREHKKRYIHKISFGVGAQFEITKNLFKTIELTYTRSGKHAVNTRFLSTKTGIKESAITLGLSYKI